MSTKTIIRCDACDKSVEVDILSRNELPEGWIILQMSRSVGGSGRSHPAIVAHACSEKCVGYSPKERTALHHLYAQALEASAPPRLAAGAGDKPS